MIDTTAASALANAEPDGHSRPHDGTAARSWRRLMSAATSLQPTQRHHIAVLILVPLIMAAIKSNWLYTPIGDLDPWYNVGYFLHYGDPTFRPAYYKLSRLSWILPGWVLYHVFQPGVANFVLHVGALLVATTFTYLTLARLVVRDAAFLAAVFLSVYFPFLGSGGWDYQTAGSGAYYALTLYCLTCAAQSAITAPSLFAAGAAFAATFHANVLFVNMAPVLICHYLIAGRDSRPHLGKVLGAMGLALAGFITVTFVLCLINWYASREFLFFQPLLAMVFSFVKDVSKSQLWWFPWSSGWVFWTGGYYLAVLLATMITGGYLLLRTPRRAWVDGSRLPSLFLIGQFIVLGVIWIIWQSLGQTALEPDYFAYPLIIPCMLALAGIMTVRARLAQTLSNRWVLLPASLLLAAVPGVDVLGHTNLLNHLLAPATTSYVRSVTAMFLIAVLLVVVMIRMLRRPLLTVAMIALFEMLFLRFSGYTVLYSSLDRCGLGRSAFDGLIDLDRFATEVSRPDRVWLWSGPPEVATGSKGCSFPVSYFRDSAVSLGLNSLGQSTETSASQITDAEISLFGPGDWVATVTTDPSRVGELRARLRQAGRETGPVQQRDIIVARARLSLLLMPVVGKLP